MWVWNSQNQPNQTGNDPKHFHIIPTSSAYLLSLTQICFVFVGSGGYVVHVDVHGERVMLWVAVATLSMADRVCLACSYAETVERMIEQCQICMVCLWLCCKIYYRFASIIMQLLANKDNYKKLYTFYCKPVNKDCHTVFLRAFTQKQIQVVNMLSINVARLIFKFLP